MKIRFLLLVLLIGVGNWMLAQKLTIYGNVKGLASGTDVFLVDFSNQNSKLASSKSSQTGDFILSTKLEAASLLILVVGDMDRVLFVSNDAVTIKGDVNTSIADWVVTGSSTQDDYQQYQKTIGNSMNQLNELLQKANNKLDSSKDDYHQLVSKIQTSIDSFITSKPASAVSTFATLVSVGITEDVKVLEQRLKRLKSRALQNMFGGRLKQVIEEAKYNAIGSKALDFSQKDADGKWVSLSQYKGQYVLVDFWASWCGPCRAENPKLVRVYQQYKNKNFTILGVSLDTEKNRWLDAIQRDELEWTQVSDLKGWENEVAKKYKVVSIPNNFLVNPEGKIIAKNLNAEELKNKLAALLN
ncbi:MAG: redoxin domain-containing protein [Chitinophagaceae bacterium]|nr:MAG: redoxin domain-containing protein [Chitinophagaceae bacterium]